MESRDHPSGSTPEGYIYQPSSPWGSPNSDTNLEGPKGLSHRNGKVSEASNFLLLVMKSTCWEQNFFQIDASTYSSHEDIPSDETPNPEDAQPSVHTKYFIANPWNQRNLSYLFMTSQVFWPHGH
jgi:hypothetical protein